MDGTFFVGPVELLNKEPYYYKIHTFLMKSSALHPATDNPSLGVRRSHCD